jgi:protein TonB
VAAGAGPAVTEPLTVPKPPLITRGPLLLTSGADLRPPYPLVKETMGEEATLTLRLLINEKGRVLTVDAIGHADPTFAEAARRHIIMHWRFQPALNSSQATMSSTVVTVAFRLDK